MAKKVLVPWKPEERHLEILDDYMSSRGQLSDDEEGRSGLRWAAPELSEAQIEIVLEAWKKEMRKEAPEWFKEREKYQAEKRGNGKKK